jgi:ribosomal protein S18 acetylase RimI-like enzyme
MTSFTSIEFDQSLFDLYKNIFQEVVADWSEYNDSINGIFGNEAQWFGLKQNDQIIAFCTIGLINDVVFLYNVGVDPLYRRKGHGFSLIKNIINKFGNKDIYLFVKKNNRQAIQLYRKFNFEYIDNAYVPPDGQICFVHTKN